VGDQPVSKPLPTQDNINRMKVDRHLIPRLGFELTTPVFVRANTVPSLDRAATVIGFFVIYPLLMLNYKPHIEIKI
jgi:hypothetical protein